jgi:UPF0755 protein
MMWKTLKRLVSLFVLGVIALVTWTAWFAVTPVTLPGPTLGFSILPGSSLRAATRQIVDAGVVMPAWQFNLLARVSASDTGIKAGSYEIARGVTPWQILRKTVQGDFAMSSIVLIEGWTFRQVREALQGHQDLRHDSAGLSDREVMQRLGSPDEKSAEGWFFPDTYLFAKGESDMAVLMRAHRTMQGHLESVWKKRAADSPLRKPYEALILASIVEKETGRSEDRTLVAGVFLNRLRIGMRLQTDPTVIYGLGARFDGNLRKRDLVADHPFNTYTRDGLPPGPIAMPGLASLQAAVEPAKIDALYFVARGDGSSAFSRTLEEHNRAVAKFQLKR